MPLVLVVEALHINLLICWKHVSDRPFRGMSESRHRGACVLLEIIGGQLEWWWTSVLGVLAVLALYIHVYVPYATVTMLCELGIVGFPGNGASDVRSRSHR